MLLLGLVASITCCEVYTTFQGRSWPATSLFRETLNQILQAPVDDLQYALACTRSMKGGLGLQDPMRAHASAFLSAGFTYAQSADSTPVSFWQELAEGGAAETWTPTTFTC